MRKECQKMRIIRKILYRKGIENKFKIRYNYYK